MTSDTETLSVEPTTIPGLLVVRLPVHADTRGWFKENWQREKMIALGLPDFGPVQHNLSFNAFRGATRGIHTEPWDKFVSVANGRVFAAWVDMREDETFGAAFHLELDPGVAVFVPRGVGNSYQALEDGTTYSYLVNDHWHPGTAYPALDLADPTVAIPWPIPLSEAELSERDRGNPQLGEVVPVPPLRTLILGGRGQLGRALSAVFPAAHPVGREELDLTDAAALNAWPWHEYAVVLNAAAWTAVDASETLEGRRSAWALNATVPATLARIATRHRHILVHYSTDYVYDGETEVHVEDEPFAPLSVYGQSKAAGDLAAASTPRHYILRTSWLVGDGPNFVRTMERLAREGVSPNVVVDQVGRLTFADELARATRHLLNVAAAYGTYNVSNGGAQTSWAGIAREVFAFSGRSPDDVIGVDSSEFAGGRNIAPRPAHSVLSLQKLETTGFTPTGAHEALVDYLTGQRPTNPDGGRSR